MKLKKDNMNREERSIRIVDIVKLEMGNVRRNIGMTPDEKNIKIEQLKVLAPKCNDWEGLDEFITDTKKWRVS